MFNRFSSYRAKFRIYERFWKIKAVFACFVALSYNLIVGVVLTKHSNL